MRKLVTYKLTKKYLEDFESFIKKYPDFYYYRYEDNVYLKKDIILPLDSDFAKREIKIIEALHEAEIEQDLHYLGDEGYEFEKICNEDGTYVNKLKLTPKTIELITSAVIEINITIGGNLYIAPRYCLHCGYDRTFEDANQMDLINDMLNNKGIKKAVIRY